MQVTLCDVAPRDGLQNEQTLFEIDQRPGDVIVAVNRKPVRNLAEFNAAISEAERAVALDVLRGDQPLFLVIT